jgi:hypothetical protein
LCLAKAWEANLINKTNTRPDCSLCASTNGRPEARWQCSGSATTNSTTEHYLWQHAAYEDYTLERLTQTFSRMELSATEHQTRHEQNYTKKTSKSPCALWGSQHWPLTSESRKSSYHWLVDREGKHT